jgi:hypothetical protein
MRPPVSPIVKWITLGVLGFVALLLLAVVLLVKRVTPLVKVDAKKDQISFFGGLIEVNADEGKVQVGVSTTGQQTFMSHAKVEGVAPVPKGGAIGVRFNNGKIWAAPQDDSMFRWKCRAHGGVGTPGPVIGKNRVDLDLTSVNEVSCELLVPEGTTLELSGAQGKVELSEPHFSADVKLANGLFEMKPDESADYRYELSVTNGSVSKFKSTDKPGAFRIKARVTNGRITRASGEEN